MSNNQKMLKIMSFVTVLAAIGMAVFTGMSFAFANTSPGMLLAICALVPAFLDVVLGCWGIGAANKPARSTGVYYIALTWLAVILSAVSVVVFVLMGGMAVPSILNLLVMALYLYYLRGVRKETLK